MDVNLDMDMDIGKKMKSYAGQLAYGTRLATYERRTRRTSINVHAYTRHDAQREFIIHPVLFAGLFIA